MKQLLCYTRASREYFNSFHTSYWTVTYSALEHTLETNDPPFLGGSTLAMHFELFRSGIYAGKKLTRLLRAVQYSMFNVLQPFFTLYLV